MIAERGMRVALRIGAPHGTQKLIQGARMLWTIAIILLILWLLGAFVVNIGGIVHLLLVIALIVIVYRLVTGRRPVA
ncbi:MAG TPA: lmo0937 family membrane protein [Gemmatimonadaceae bacterium]|nr:lmo0937 family membrane protein [Gemmatimonadaceae bacterium]